MKHVWKCDHCTEVSSNSAEIIRHEKTCYMNPTTKNCGTCKKNEKVNFDNAWACILGIETGEHQILPCDLWEEKVY